MVLTWDNDGTRWKVSARRDGRDVSRKLTTALGSLEYAGQSAKGTKVLGA